jgi:hypothetical protein
MVIYNNIQVLLVDFLDLVHVADYHLSINLFLMDIVMKIDNAPIGENNRYLMIIFIILII